MKEITEAIKTLRFVRNLTQGQLAKKAKLSQSMLSEIERGIKDPSLSTLVKLAKALDVKVVELFTTSRNHVRNRDKDEKDGILIRGK